MGGFVWQAMLGKLGIVGSKCFGRALSSGLVGCYEFGFMFKLPLVVPAAWFLVCDSQVILAKCSYVLPLHLLLLPLPRLRPKLWASFSGILSTKTKGFGCKPGLKGQTDTYPATCCRVCAASLGIAAMPGERILLPNLTFPRSLLSLPNSPLNSTPAVFCGKTDGSNK